MREQIGKTFLDDLFGFLDEMIDMGKEVHIVDQSDPDNVVEHVFNKSDDDIPFGEEEDEDLCKNYSSCSECPVQYECDECAQVDLDCEEYEPDMWGIPDIDRIVFSGPATIVFWMDGTKTVVKCMEGEKFERYAGFAAACMKKMFGSTSRAKAIMNEVAVEQIPNVEKIPDEEDDDVAILTKEQQIANDEAIQEAINETFNG